MKKKTLVALLLVLALACVPLVGCGSDKGYSTTKKLDLNDYFVTASDTAYGVKYSTARKAFTTATAEDGQYNRVGGKYGTKANESGKLSVYDFNKHAAVLTDKTYDNVSVYDGLGSNKLLVCYNVGDYYAYDIYDYNDLEAVTSFTSYVSISTNTMTKYVGGKATRLLDISYKATSGSDVYDHKYFALGDGSRTAKRAYSEVNVSDIKNTDIVTGTVIDASAKQAIYETDGIVTYNEMKDYSVAISYTDSELGIEVATFNLSFFKNNDKTGEVTVTDGMPLAFVEKYFYYAEYAPVAYDAVKGYNFIYQRNSNDNTTAQKYNVTYYRYDITKNKTSKVDFGFIVGGNCEHLYNYADNKYDAVVLEAYQMFDGVANSNSTPMTLIVDKDFKVGYDFTGKPFGIDEKLKENRFIASSNGSTYIYDKKLEIVASFDSTNYSVNADLGLITFQKGNRYMAVDFDGNVIFEPKYSNLTFYGDTAIASVYNDQDETDGNVRVSKINPNGSEIAVGANETVAYTGYGLTVVSSAAVDGVTSYTLLNYGGTSLCTFKAIAFYPSSNIQFYYNASTGEQFAYFNFVDENNARKTIVATC